MHGSDITIAWLKMKINMEVKIVFLFIFDVKLFDTC